VFRDGALLRLPSSDDEPPRRGPDRRRPRLVGEDDQALAAILSDAIGGSGKLIVAIDRFQLQDGDTLLLGSDSLTAALPEEQIADIVGDRRNPNDLARRLVASAVDAGSPATVTALLARYRIPVRVS